MPFIRLRADVPEAEDAEGVALSEPLTEPAAIAMFAKGTADLIVGIYKLISGIAKLMAGVLLLVIALIFLKNQTKPLVKLAKAAERFGKGDYVNDFRASGSQEIRKAA